jgi:hypothetical protein
MAAASTFSRASATAGGSTLTGVRVRVLVRAEMRLGLLQDDCERTGVVHVPASSSV